MANNTLTDDIYWAAQDPKVQVLRNLPSTPDGLFDLATRESTSATLFSEGFVPDRAIWIEGWAPARLMEIRQAYGYTSFPNAFALTPTIKVSTDANDYQPFKIVTPYVPSTSPIGPQVGDSFGVNISVVEVNHVFMFKDGDQYTENGVTYIFHNIPSMFGPQLSWTKK